MDDHGLFGPHSVTWRVHLEPVMWVAGMRALLLQSLHPRVMRGTYQNSALFDPKKAWSRFERTVEFVGTRTFGPMPEVERAGARVRNLHAGLRGYDPDTDETFRIDEAAGLLWVHCGEIGSYLDIARRSGLIDDDEADRYVAESVRAAQVVGLDPAIVPSSAAEMAAYFDRMRPELHLTEEARRAAGNLIAPRGDLPATSKLLISTISTLGFATLPRWARRMYGLPGLPTTDLSTTLTLRALCTASGVLPDIPAPPEIQEARRLVREAVWPPCADIAARATVSAHDPVNARRPAHGRLRPATPERPRRSRRRAAGGRPDRSPPFREGLRPAMMMLSLQCRRRRREMIREAELFLKAQPVLNEVVGRIRPEEWSIQLPPLLDIPGYDRPCTMRAAVVRLAREDARVPAMLTGKDPGPADEDPLGEDPHAAAVRCSQTAGDAARAVTDGDAEATDLAGSTTTVADVLWQLTMARSFLAHDIAMNLGSRACPLHEDLSQTLWERAEPDAARWRERGMFREPLPLPPPEIHVSWRDQFLMGAGRDPHPWMHRH